MIGVWGLNTFCNIGNTFRDYGRLWRKPWTMRKSTWRSVFLSVAKLCKRAELQTVVTCSSTQCWNQWRLRLHDKGSGFKRSFDTAPKDVIPRKGIAKWRHTANCRGVNFCVRFWPRKELHHLYNMFFTSRFLHAFQQSQPVVAGVSAFLAGLLLLNETVRDFDVSLVWRGNLQRWKMIPCLSSIHASRILICGGRHGQYCPVSKSYMPCTLKRRFGYILINRAG